MTEHEGLWDREADIIEEILAAHNVFVSVDGGKARGTTVEYYLRLLPGSSLNRVRTLAGEVALHLGVKALRVEVRSGYVALIRPRRDAKLPLLTDALLASESVVRKARRAQQRKYGHGHSSAITFMGLTEDDVPMLPDFGSPATPHMLIAGATGSGKTTLLQTTVLSLIFYNRVKDVLLILISPKPYKFEGMAVFPHVLGNRVASDAKDIRYVLEWGVAMMDYRDKTRQSRPRIVVVIDELLDILLHAGPDVVELLTRLSVRGREAGIHLLAATQRPTARDMGGIMKANFPARIVGYFPSSQDARVAAGVSDTGAEQMRPGQFAFVAGGKIIRFHMPMAGPAEMDRAIAEAQRRYAHALARLNTTVPFSTALPQIPGFDPTQDRREPAPMITPAFSTSQRRAARRQTRIAQMRENILAVLNRYDREEDFPSMTSAAREMGYSTGGAGFYAFREAWTEAVAAWRAARTDNDTSGDNAASLQPVLV